MGNVPAKITGRYQSYDINTPDQLTPPMPQIKKNNYPEINKSNENLEKNQMNNFYKQKRVPDDQTIESNSKFDQDDTQDNDEKDDHVDENGNCVIIMFFIGFKILIDKSFLDNIENHVEKKENSVDVMY